MASRRRDKTKPGLGGLTDTDRNAWEAGTVTLADLGQRVGVSPQAVSKEIRRRGWKRGTVSSSTPGAVVPTASSTVPIPVTSEQVEGAVTDTALSLLQLINREIARLTSDPTLTVGPSQLKALAGALTAVRADLQSAGIVRSADHAEAPETLTVRTLSTEEEAKVRDNAESGGIDDLEEHRDTPVPVPSAPVENNSPRIASESQIRVPWLLGPLPPREGFRAWLSLLAAQRGNSALRSILSDLGHPTEATAASRDLLVGEIVRATRGDPEALRKLKPS